MGCSDKAVVATAFGAPGDPDVTLPRGGIRPMENRDDVDIRDAREPGRSGEGIEGMCV